VKVGDIGLLRAVTEKKKLAEGLNGSNLCVCVWVCVCECVRVRLVLGGLFFFVLKSFYMDHMKLHIVTYCLTLCFCSVLTSHIYIERVK